MENTTKYLFEEIDINDLILDDKNPRIPRSLKDKGPTEQELIEFMLLDASLIELMLAIGENGYFPGEQLLVVKDGEKHRVVEGNRRLSAVKLLNNPELATVQKAKVQKVIEETSERPQKIPCLIFNSEEEIHKYLGFRHITGIKEWRLLEKARYLDGLKNSLFGDAEIKNASREIAKMIGSKMDYVRRVLVGFQIYKNIEDENFYKIRDLDDTTFYFNYIVDSLNKANIRKFIGVDFENTNPLKDLSLENLKKWTHWLFEKNDQNKTRLIGNSSNLNDLNTILSEENKEALVAFESSGYSLERAIELTGELDHTFKDFIIRAYNNLEKADSLVIRVNHIYPDLLEDLRKIKVLADKIKYTSKRNDDE